MDEHEHEYVLMELKPDGKEVATFYCKRCLHFVIRDLAYQ